MTDDSLIIVGRIKRAHGIRGEMVVEPLTDEPDAIFASGCRVIVGDSLGDTASDSPALTVQAVRPFRESLLVTFYDIPDRTAAELWRGRFLLVPASEVSDPAEGEVFIHELIGMSVVSVVGAPYGVVSDIYDVPQGILLEVKLTDGNTGLLPYHSEMVISTDRLARTVVVDIPEGLF